MASLFKTVTSAADSSFKSDKPTGPKSRILILSSRGVTYRHRHLLHDLAAMLPHSRKDAKLDTKSQLHYLNEVAELYNCNGVLFFEARKRQDLYLWLSRVPNGPCVKFHVQNLHTMSELNFTGNALLGSRPIVSFDSNFDSTPSLSLMKELLLHTFSVPKGARKSKPFVDRVVSFTVSTTDGKIWLRHWQIQPTADVDAATKAAEDTGDGEKEKKKKRDEKSNLELIEIGPRLVLTPIVILEGSFGGPVVYENKEFVSPNAVRASLREKRAQRKGGRDMQRTKRNVKKKEVEKEARIAKALELELDSNEMFQ